MDFQWNSLFNALICSKALRQGWLFSLGSCLVEGLIGKYWAQLKSASSVIRDKGVALKCCCFQLEVKDQLLH